MKVTPPVFSDPHHPEDVQKYWAFGGCHSFRRPVALDLPVASDGANAVELPRSVPATLL